MSTFNDFSELPGAQVSNSQNEFIENMPQGRKSITDVPADAPYIFDFAHTNPVGKYEIIAIPVPPDNNPAVKTDPVYIAEGPFDTVQDAQQFIRGHKIGKPAWRIHNR